MAIYKNKLLALVGTGAMGIALSIASDLTVAYSVEDYDRSFQMVAERGAMSAFISMFIGYLAIRSAPGTVSWFSRSLYDYFFSPHGRFWRTVARDPELALSLLSKERDCLIEPTSAVPKGFAGPFRITGRTGRVWRIYLLLARIDDIEARVLQKIEQAIAANVERSP
jgi:hypothetical protein